VGSIADRTVSIDLIGRDRTTPAFNSAARSASHAEGSFHKAGASFRALGAIAAGAVVAGVGAAGVALKILVGDAQDAEKANALTAAVLKSTGGAAKVSAAQVTALATAISEKTGIDDTAIQSNENLLLTFTNIHNEVGKGNKIFNRATMAVTDMSVALGEDTKNASIQLGKALNDPIKGITALSRVGVSFTAQQKDQIKTLVDSGHTLDAQKVILKELGKEFGGAAVAAATPMDKLKATLHNVSEELGGKLLPWINKGATALLGLVKGMQDGTGPGGKLAGIFHQIGGAVGAVVPVVVSVGKAWATNILPVFVMIAQQVGPQLKATFDRIAGALRDHMSVFTQLGQILHALAIAVIPVLVVAIKAVGVIFQGLVFVLDKVILPKLKAFIEFNLTAFGAVVNGAAKAFGWIPGLGPKLKAAAGAFNTFRGNVEAALNGLGGKGYNLGLDFANGLARGISAGGKVAVATAQGVANRVAAGVAAAHQSHSPSKVAIKLGEFFSHGLAVGIAKGGKVAIKAAKDLATQIGGKISDLKSQAKGIASAAADSVRGVLDLSSIGQAVETTTAGVTTPGRSIIDPVTGAVTTSDATTSPDVTTSSTPSAASSLAGFASQAQAFATALAAMARKGLAPALIAAVAAAGPASGLTAAQAFASESKADDASVNASMKAIDKAAGQVGAQQRAASGLDKPIRDLTTKVDELNKALGAGKAATLTISKGGDLIVTYVNDANKKNARKK
jgi:acid phosphatase family membrane protein YuiD